MDSTLVGSPSAGSGAAAAAVGCATAAGNVWVVASSGGGLEGPGAALSAFELPASGAGAVVVAVGMASAAVVAADSCGAVAAGGAAFFFSKVKSSTFA